MNILELFNVCKCVSKFPKIYNDFYLLQSHNEEDMSDGEPHSGTEQDDHDSCDGIRRHGILADHNDVLTKLKMQVRDINVRVSNGLFPYANQVITNSNPNFTFLVRLN